MTGTVLSDKMAKRRLVLRSVRFCVIDDNLFKRSFAGSYLKCVGMDESK